MVNYSKISIIFVNLIILSSPFSTRDLAQSLVLLPFYHLPRLFKIKIKVRVKETDRRLRRINYAYASSCFPHSSVVLPDFIDICPLGNHAGSLGPKGFVCRCHSLM